MPNKTVPPCYQVWFGMIRRCYQPKDPAYKNYGARGITVCDRWRNSYHNFIVDMGLRPKGKWPNGRAMYTIDRIDNDGPYSPENCRWATRKEQARNKRDARYVTIEGKQYRAMDLANQISVKTDTIIKRAEKGLSLDQVLSAEKLVSRRIPIEAVAANKQKAKQRTHCSNGHKFTPETHRFTAQGWHRCLTCHAEKERKRVAKKKLLKP